MFSPSNPKLLLQTTMHFSTHILQVNPLQILKYTINKDRSPAYIKAWVGGLTTTCNNIEYYIHTCQNIIDTNTLKFAWRHTLGITHILAQLQLLLESDVIVVVMCGFCIKRMRMCIRDVTRKKLLKKHLTYYILINFISELMFINVYWKSISWNYSYHYS